MKEICFKIVYYSNMCAWGTKQILIYNLKLNYRLEFKQLCIQSLYQLANIPLMSQPEQKEPQVKPQESQKQEEPEQQPNIVIHQVAEAEEEQNKIQNPPAEVPDKNGKNEDPEKLGTPDKQNQDNQPSDQDVDGQEDVDGDQEGKSKRNQSSDSNRQDNDTSQLKVTKKCFNKLCNSKKIYKKIRSKVQTQRYRFLCKNCYENYVRNFFCEFCEQIYENYENEEDDTKWVGCDKCQRWNHIQCERKYRHKNFQINKDKDIQYQCLSCSKKNRNGQSNQQNQTQSNKRKPIERDYEGTRNYRTKMQINKDERIPIFHKKPDIFPCLQSFLQTYNFRLWLNDANIREDIESLRSLNRRPALEQEPKNKKKVKLDY